MGNIDGGPFFTFSLPWEVVRTPAPPPASYTTDQVRFKHEQP